MRFSRTFSLLKILLFGVFLVASPAPLSAQRSSVENRSESLASWLNQEARSRDLQVFIETYRYQSDSEHDFEKLPEKPVSLNPKEPTIVSNHQVELHDSYMSIIHCDLHSITNNPLDFELKRFEFKGGKVGELISKVLFTAKVSYPIFHGGASDSPGMTSYVPPFQENNLSVRELLLKIAIKYSFSLTVEYQTEKVDNSLVINQICIGI